MAAVLDEMDANGVQRAIVTANMSRRFYKFGQFSVDALNHVLLRDGETLPLKPKVFDTLLC